LRVPVPSVVVPFRNVTVPVGTVVVPEGGATTAVKVTLLPAAMLALLDVRVVVETNGVAVIVTLIAIEVEDLLFASPP
jgi:hypothetical protein